MKTPFRPALLCLATAFFCGCASRHAGPVYRAGDEVPPGFLTGPVAMVLTNLGGFSAHVISTITAPDEPPQTRSGELLGREGVLLFQPTLALKGKRKQTEGGLFFIWDEKMHSGYVMSEALQAYAPISPLVVRAARLNFTQEGVQEEIDGHPCHRREALVELDDGRKERMTLWEADDDKHFPVRIEAMKGIERMTLNFSEVRLEYPAQELFLPPDGFTSYASATAMMNELIVRDASYAKKSSGPDLDQPVDSRSGNWHGSPSGSPLGAP
jgi:hypothetical protein